MSVPDVSPLISRIKELDSKIHEFVTRHIRLAALVDERGPDDEASQRHVAEMKDIVTQLKVLYQERDSLLSGKGGDTDELHENCCSACCQGIISCVCCCTIRHKDLFDKARMWRVSQNIYGVQLFLTAAIIICGGVLTAATDFYLKTVIGIANAVFAALLKAFCSFDKDILKIQEQVQNLTGGNLLGRELINASEEAILFQLRDKQSKLREKISKTNPNLAVAAKNASLNNSHLDNVELSTGLNPSSPRALWDSYRSELAKSGGSTSGWTPDRKWLEFTNWKLEKHIKLMKNAQAMQQGPLHHSADSEIRVDASSSSPPAITKSISVRFSCSDNSSNRA